MAARKKFKIALDIDNRTNTMTDEALVCRTFGHKWARNPLSRSRVLELLQVGCDQLPVKASILDEDFVGP